MHRRSQRAFWAFYALVYDVVWDSPLTTQVATAALGDSPRSSVVDLGCGTGLASQSLITSGATVVGVDGATAMVRRALRAHRISRGHVADLASTGLAGHSADLVLAVNVLHVHPRPGTVLDEMVRLASVGGTLAIAFPTDDADSARVFASDRIAGRAWLRSARAAILRRIIAVPAHFTKVSRNSEASVIAAVVHACRTHNLAVSHHEVLFGCQHVMRIGRAESTCF